MIAAMKNTSLDAIRIFLAVAEMKSFTAAAIRIGVTPAAASKAVKLLEARHGVILLTRNTRRVMLTETGSATVFSLDGTYALGQVAPGLNSLVYAGGRYGLFQGAINYEGESTTYSSSNFGIGAGLMLSYPLSGGLSLVGDLGVDQFFGGAVNVRQSSGADTDAGAAQGVYRQPGTVFKARIGIKTGF